MNNETLKLNLPTDWVLVQINSLSSDSLYHPNSIWAVCLDGSKWHEWLFFRHPDGQWVSERKLEQLEIMQAEDQRDESIVIINNQPARMSNETEKPVSKCGNKVHCMHPCCRTPPQNFNDEDFDWPGCTKCDTPGECSDCGKELFGS